MSDLINASIVAIHVLGAGIIIGSIFTSLLILINNRISKDNLKYLKLLWKFITPAIGIQILTGIYMAAREWDEFGKSPLFWAKIILLVIDGFFGGKILHDRIDMAVPEKNNTVKIPGARRLIWLTFLIFLIITTLGVFLAESG